MAGPPQLSQQARGWLATGREGGYQRKWLPGSALMPVFCALRRSVYVLNCRRANLCLESGYPGLAWQGDSSLYCTLIIFFKPRRQKKCNFLVLFYVRGIIFST